MKLLPLKIVCKAGNWQHFHDRTLSKNYGKIKDVISARDESACSFCGYPSDKNELINKDGNYNNNKQDNIVLSCSICRQILLFDGHGLADDFGGRIVFLPEISQIDINHFMRTVYATMKKQPSFKSRLTDIMINIDERKDEVEGIFGKTSSDAKNFSQGLLDTFIDEKKLQHEIMKSLKFIPDKSMIENEIEDFISYYFD